MFTDSTHFPVILRLFSAHFALVLFFKCNNNNDDDDDDAHAEAWLPLASRNKTESSNLGFSSRHVKGGRGGEGRAKLYAELGILRLAVSFNKQPSRPISL